MGDSAGADGTDGTDGAAREQRDHDDPGPLSIGEVLAVLAEEFPDVTISKIRFLESQGLVRPERNASGYRQFGDEDIERLRWILRQQRDHFLPLKVIKKTLDTGVQVIDAGVDQPTLWTAVADEVAAGEAVAERRAGRRAERRAERDTAARGSAPSRSDEGDQRRHSTAADVVAALQEDPRGPNAPPLGVANPATSSTEAPQGGGPSERGVPPLAHGERIELTREEILESSGLSEASLDDLETFGLLEPAVVAGEPVYDGTDLLVCNVARRCGELGVGPRHLRIYKVAAVREAGLIEQVVMPLLKQRNPAARSQATETASELSLLGAQVHAALLARGLGSDLAP